ncbi:Lar family restriction alleviation protein [Acetobacter sp. AC2005]|uniref:Lar family restriction alleviation protein n=1 Tax=Acetobacter sp. AC2005 TaxID=3134142 RepID=UPI0030D16F27
MSEELKPCPFCGATNSHLQLSYIGGEVFFVTRNECITEGPARKIQSEAITAWNTRAGEKS